MRILVVNAGSSSLKLRVLDDTDAIVFASDLPAQEGTSPISIPGIAEAGPIDAVGHRIVHGGIAFRDAVRIDAAVVAALRELTDLAPLHQPKALAAVDAVTALLPSVPAVACFDTAFHAGMPAAAATYALPAEWRSRWPIRRFGFHGLSHAYVSGRVAELLGRPLDELRIVTCHLGAGASLAAVSGGRSIDTTMGFTPLEGLIMATRSGSVDPGLLLWLVDRAGVSAGELAMVLEGRSGLLALAGTADMREIIAAEAHGDATAALALAAYLHRLRAGIASMAAAMDGLDALAFTGGVGENAALIRSRAAAGLGFLGVAIDPVRNEDHEGDRQIGAPGGRVATLVVESREDIEIARQVRRVLGFQSPARPPDGG